MKPSPKRKIVQGIKYDDGKPRYDLLPPEPLEEVVKVYTFGAKKYEENNWRKGMKWSRTFSAIMRHCWAFWRGEEFDKESGLHHMAHAAFGCLALIEYTKTRRSFDDRSKIWSTPYEREVVTNVFVAPDSYGKM